MADRGFITLAFGSTYYLGIARNLARSLKLAGNEHPLAIVTDLLEEDLGDFDVVLPLPADADRSLFQKLSLDLYSPFTETIFLDSDCLVVRDLEPLFEQLGHQDFAVVGSTVTAGEWFGRQIADLRQERGIAGGLPKFNSGLIYWRQSEVASGIFASARELWEDYETLGFGAFRGGTLSRADEPIFALAMASHGIRALDDDGTVMNTPIGLSGRVRLNLTTHESRFVKHGVLVSPAVMHFCGYFRYGGSYRREVSYLNLAPHIGPRASRLACNIMWAVPVALDRGAVWATARALKRAVSTR